MITFTQTDDYLSCDSSYIGNQFSDVTVQVDLTDDTFKNLDYVGLYICDPISEKTYRSAVINGKALIEHQKLENAGDIFVALVGYNLNPVYQITTNSLPMVLGESANPEKVDTTGEDWKQATSDKLIREATEKFVKEYIEEHGLQIEVPDGTGGSGSGEVSLSAVNSVLSTGANFARVGNMGICMGTFTLPKFHIDTAVGSLYYADALIQGSGPLQLSGNFPFCFSEKPTVTVSLSGLTSMMFMGGMRADEAGITRMRLYHPTAKTSDTDISCRFIAVGRVDGKNAAAAAVISEAIPFVNEERHGTYSSLNEYFYTMYETYIGSTGRNGWCSEFWSVCTYLAGFEDDSVCPKGAGAYIIAGKISDKGNFYIRSGSGTNSKFVHATMTAGKTYADKANFAYTIDGTTEYIPQIGDVLFCQGVNSGYNYPHHTAIVVSVDINDEGYFINTVEGNQSNNDEDYTGTSVRRRARNMYTTTQITGKNILAVGHIDYPTSYNYADKTADGTSSSGGSGTETGGSTSGETSTTPAFSGETNVGSTASGKTISLIGVTATVSENTIVLSDVTATASENTIVLSGTSGGTSGESTPTYYSLTFDEQHCKVDNTPNRLLANSNYTTTVTADEGYTLSSVRYIMGGQSYSAVNGVINVQVTGDIIILAVATASEESSETTYHTVSITAPNCTIDNTQTTVADGESYTVTITANFGYIIDGISTVGAFEQEWGRDDNAKLVSITLYLNEVKTNISATVTTKEMV